MSTTIEVSYRVKTHVELLFYGVGQLEVLRPSKTMFPCISSTRHALVVTFVSSSEVAHIRRHNVVMMSIDFVSKETVPSALVPEEFI